MGVWMGGHYCVGLVTRSLFTMYCVLKRLVGEMRVKKRSVPAVGAAHCSKRQSYRCGLLAPLMNKSL